MEACLELLSEWAATFTTFEALEDLLVRVGQLADADEAFLTGHDLDECAEVGDALDRARVDGVDLGLGREALEQRRRQPDLVQHHRLLVAPQRAPHQQRGLAGLQAQRAEQLRDAVGLLVELPVGHNLAAAGHDIGRFVWIRLGVDVGVHSELPPAAFLSGGP